jgi:molecular chaperone GrpE
LISITFWYSFVKLVEKNQKFGIIFRMEEENNKTEEEIDTDPGDDFVFEDNTEVTGGDYKEKVKKLQTKIKDLEKKNSELLNSWQRDKADFINSKKRDEEDKKEFLKFAKADVISELLSVLDSFESAFKNKEAWEKVDKNWRMGVEYIHSQLNSILTSHGLKVINPIGDVYNPVRDEAIENIKVDNRDDDSKILEVMQVGYELNGKEIRPPKVKVGHFEENANS